MDELPFNGKNTAIRLMNEYGIKKKPFIFIIDFTLENSLILPLETFPSNEILFDINGLTNNPKSEQTAPIQIQFEKSPVSYEEYLSRFTWVKQEIAFGNTYLLNLTCPTPVSVNLSLKEIFERSKAKYRLWMNGQFVVFSPETFVTIHEGVISSFPMKGTIDAAIPDAAGKLISDQKELAEHYTIVDLIRNDLSAVAKKVKVEEFRYIEKLETNFGALLQVSSRISGILPQDYPGKIGNIMFSLLPAGSVSGAPKEKTLKIIHEVEGYARGFYTGIFGYFDGCNLDSGVMIRFIESIADGLIFKSGGGITSYSDPLSEYHEMIDKVYVPFT